MKHVLAVLFAGLQLATAQPAYPGLPSETPKNFVRSTSSFDYTRREEMVAMRDG